MLKFVKLDKPVQLKWVQDLKPGETFVFHEMQDPYLVCKDEGYVPVQPDCILVMNMRDFTVINAPLNARIQEVNHYGFISE